MIDWLACTAVKLIGGLLSCLRPNVAVWIGEQLGWLASWVQPKRTRIGFSNLLAAFDGKLTPSEARRILRACYKQLGAGFVELLRLPVIDRAYVDRYVTLEGRQHLDEALTSGKAVIFLTGHYGNWEFSSIVAALLGYPVVALARAQNKLPKLYRLLVSYRESKGCLIVHKGGAMKQLITALNRRKLVGIVGDQASRQGLLVDFFGRPALFATGPFELAYRKDALIVPVAIHRVRGPFHRICVEPPIRVSREESNTQAIRAALEQFTRVLARHIEEDPSQWLWMHRRWKHTHTRRVLVLSDGKAGHLKQSLAVVEALRAHQLMLSHAVIEIRYRHRLGRLLTILWSWWIRARVGGVLCLRWALTHEAASALLSRCADLIISCGASIAPVNLLWAREHGAKSIVLMNPAPLPVHRFDLVISPRHDGLPRRSNVVHTAGAVVKRWDEVTQQAAVEHLQGHPRFRLMTPDVAARYPHVTRGPVIAVLIGGDTLHYTVTSVFAEALIAEVKTACEALDGRCLVTTSRRTGLPVEADVSRWLEGYARCQLILLAHRDELNGTMEGMLGVADIALVTGESISMVSEACASGRRVLVVECPLRHRTRTVRMKHQRFLQGLAREGYLRIVPVSHVAQAIQHAWSDARPAKRLDDFSTIRDAIARLL